MARSAAMAIPVSTQISAGALGRQVRVLSLARLEGVFGSSQPNGRLGFQLKFDSCDLSVPKVADVLFCL